MRARAIVVVVAVALAACAEPTPPVAPPVIYPAATPPWPRPPVTARMGQGLARTALVGLPVRAVDAAAPLATIALVGAEDGAAEAALSGRDRDGVALELVDVDAGVVRWRRRQVSAPPVAIVGARVYAATSDAVVSLDRATGDVRATLPARWLVGGAQPLVAVDGGLAALVDDTLGPTVAPPEGAPVAAVVAACGARASWAVAWYRGALARWQLDGARATVAWSVPSPQPMRVICDDAGPIVVVGGGAALALDPATGAALGPRVPVADAWLDPRDRDRVELATDAGVERRPRTLVGVDAVVPVRAARWLTGRGARRVVAGLDGAPILLDGEQAWALAGPGGEATLVAGERALVAGPWRWPAVSLGQRLTRYAWPTEPPTPAASPPAPTTLVPAAAHVDLPPPGQLEVAITAEAGAWAVGAALIDPADAERIYAVTLEARPDDATGAGVVALDLHAGRARWHSPSACPPGQPIAVAATAGRIACAARGSGYGAGAVATIDAADGRPVWTWRGDTVDAILGAGGVFAIVAGSTLVLVDAGTGATLATWRTTDGYLPRVALAGPADALRVATYEHGAVVVRDRRLGWAATDAIAVDGVVVALAAMGDRWLATLADGTAYLIGGDGAPVVAAALATAWHPRGDRAYVFTTAAAGAAAITAIDGTGLVRASLAIPGWRVASIGVRADTAGAPLAIAGDGGEVAVVDDAGRVTGRAPLPEPTAPLFATVVDGRPVAGALLARPLRLAYVAP